jgi:hypothetical protein
MAKLLKIIIPMLVTADGKWSASGSSEANGEPDWPWLDEMCDHEKPTVNPQRYWIETVVEIPETKTVCGVAMPENQI